jgi:hypothetical protein
VISALQRHQSGAGNAGGDAPSGIERHPHLVPGKRAALSVRKCARSVPSAKSLAGNRISVVRAAKRGTVRIQILERGLGGVERQLFCGFRRV